MPKNLVSLFGDRNFAEHSAPAETVLPLNRRRNLDADDVVAELLDFHVQFRLGVGRNELFCVRNKWKIRSCGIGFECYHGESLARVAWFSCTTDQAKRT
jgi:hypothetical protein